MVSQGTPCPVQVYHLLPSPILFLLFLFLFLFYPQDVAPDPSLTDLLLGAPHLALQALFPLEAAHSLSPTPPDSIVPPCTPAQWRSHVFGVTAVVTELHCVATGATLLQLLLAEAAARREVATPEPTPSFHFTCATCYTPAFLKGAFVDKWVSEGRAMPTRCAVCRDWPGWAPYKCWVCKKVRTMSADKWCWYLSKGRAPRKTCDACKRKKGEGGKENKGKKGKKQGQVPPAAN